jgi:regulatory protein
VRQLESDQEPPENPARTRGDHGVTTEAERLQQALDLAYAYLNPRDRTVAEVCRRLRGRGVSEELTEMAVRTLEEQGFLSDARFARLFVADKRRLEQWGSERIRRGLVARGIDRDLADTALAEGVAGTDGAGTDRDGTDRDGMDGDGADRGGAGGRASAGRSEEEPETELDRALAVLRRRFPDPPQDRRERNRALGLLLRKGYESELALSALSAHARAD